jgi:hypothetical protein
MPIGTIILIILVAYKRDGCDQCQDRWKSKHRCGPARRRYLGELRLRQQSVPSLALPSVGSCQPTTSAIMFGSFRR